MSKVWAITPVNEDPFVITWDLGRRCNYDCTYCPAHRHDNFSPHASLDNLKSTADFMFAYIDQVAEYRKNKDFYISFTGGEPTVNPSFTEFAKYLKTYKSKYSVKLDLTTNGAMSKRIAQTVIDCFDHVTVSYHAEAKQSTKKQVLDRILQFSAAIPTKVNVMMHAKLFDDCKDFCNTLKQNNVKFIPRRIGDDPDAKFSQAHEYTADHIEWFKNEWNMEINPTTRPCCGGRTFGACSSEGITETKVINDRNFKGWACSVNWFFLHIEQQTELVYHHQTCQADFDEKRGAIGSLNNTKEIIDNLKNNITKTIICPNNLCGCGLCVPKSLDHAEFKNITKTVYDI